MSSFSVYAGKKVLVTGGAGFIGSALTISLVNENANVVVLDNFVSGKKTFLEPIIKDVRIVEKSILSNDLADLFKKEEFDFVFNLAALPYIPKCYSMPKEFFEVNTLGALNVLLACKEAQVKRVLHYSTSEVYGGAQRIPMDEHHPLNPASTYAASKVGADRLCFTLYYEQEIPVIILRQFNVFGPRET
ncbi:MAG: NAD-dependent epimerase/dehydratase family protein, partial [Candidatus Diapherotrites archaeon]